MTIDRLRAALLASGSADAAGTGLRGDWDVASDPAPEADGALTPAAVLIALTAEASPQLLLTRRNATMRRHAGQIAFPGGRIDPGDRDAIAAALREAEEEVALGPAQVDVIGTLDRYRTGTGYSIVPVVGVVPPGLVLTPHAAEVAEIFHVPFAFVMDPANHELRTGSWQGRDRRFYAIRYGEREIWGATAAMLVNLSRRLA